MNGMPPLARHPKHHFYFLHKHKKYGIYLLGIAEKALERLGHPLFEPSLLND